MFAFDEGHTNAERTCAPDVTPAMSPQKEEILLSVQLRGQGRNKQW